MFALIEDLRDTGIAFLNLNELEITVGNHDQMDVRGFNLSDGITAAAAGSSELAERLRDRVRSADVSAPDPEDGEIRDAYGYHLKFCTAVFKDAGQLRRRFLRRGESTIAPHEILTEMGLSYSVPYIAHLMMLKVTCRNYAMSVICLQHSCIMIRMNQELRFLW